MKLIGTFFLGIVIALASLVVQVFVGVISEIFFGTYIAIQYSPTDTILHIIILMVIAATIEELLRYIAIKKNTVFYTDTTIRNIMLYGTLLGAGFASFEIILVTFGQSFATISLLSIVPVLMIHITLSIFLLYIATKKQTLLRDMPYVIIAIVFHVLSNFLLFHLLTL